MSHIAILPNSPAYAKAKLDFLEVAIPSHYDENPKDFARKFGIFAYEGQGKKIVAYFARKVNYASCIDARHYCATKCKEAQCTKTACKKYLASLCAF